MDVKFVADSIKESLIIVAGIGGGGGNAVKHMYTMGIDNVSYLVINTDSQVLERSPIMSKIQLGDGLGAGNNPEKARVEAEQSADIIKETLKKSGAKMIFITAGMGGGTGTGASPVVARIARELKLLTVGIVSIPYRGEGPRRVKQAVEGINELMPYVDSIVIINNEHIAEIYGKLGITEAHSKADDVLATAAKSISEIVINSWDVNVDFADVKTTIGSELQDQGDNAKIVLMGSAESEETGDDRALKLVERAVNSPLLHHNDIKGARKVLFRISWGNDDIQFSYAESNKVMDFLQQRSGLTNDLFSNQTDIIWCAGKDESLGNKISVTVIAAGFSKDNIPEIQDYFLAGQKNGKPVVKQEPVKEMVSLSLLDDEGEINVSSTNEVVTEEVEEVEVEQNVSSDDELTVVVTEDKQEPAVKEVVVEEKKVEEIIVENRESFVEKLDEEVKPAVEERKRNPMSEGNASILGTPMQLVVNLDENFDKVSSQRGRMSFTTTSSGHKTVSDNLDGRYDARREAPKQVVKSLFED